MQRWTVLRDNDFQKYSQAHVAMSIMIAWRFLPEGLMGMCIQQRYLSLDFKHWDFPWLPESFHDIMNCGWWKTEILCNIALRKHCHLTDWQLSHEVWNKVVNLNPFLLAKTKPLVDAPFIHNLCYQVNCYLWSLPEQCCFFLCPTFFFKCVAGVTFCCFSYLQNMNLYNLSMKTLKCFLCTFIS